jgi:putative ABC transport system permease protein
MGPDMDDQILAPYTTVMKKLMGATWIREITISAASAGETSAVADAVALMLRSRHQIAPGQEDDFFVRTAEEIADIRTAAMGTMTTLLAGIAGVSLVVGGIGIMNIMLVSVTERTKEIGLRMAIGAKGRDVLWQFLVEAISLSLIGGGIGVAIGFGLAEGMSRWMSWPAKVPPGAVGMAFGFAAATGVFFGFYPAQKAARLDPIDALRFE